MKYILNGKLGLALKSIPLKHLSNGLKRDIAVLTYRFNSIKNDFKKGFITYENFCANRTRIVDSLLSQLIVVEDEIVMYRAIKKMP